MVALSKSDFTDSSTTKAIPANINWAGRHLVTSPPIGLPCCLYRKAGLIFGVMDVQELGEGYRNKTNNELLRLALTPEQLTPEAQAALTAELATRGINGEANLDAARHEEGQRKVENDKELGTLGFVFGVGRMR